MSKNARATNHQIAQIAIDVPLKTLFSYSVPVAMQNHIRRGQRVRVRFRNKDKIGICLDLTNDSTPLNVQNKKISYNDLNEIIEIVDQEGALDATYLKWLSFAAKYYSASIGQVIAQAVPPLYLDVKKATSIKETRSREISFDSEFQTKFVDLTPKQHEIYNKILSHFGKYHPVLLQGVTGSGKTEIYIQLIKKALDQNKSSLFLVPEIGLTPQMLARLNHHFKGSLLVYHSGLTKNQRLNQWKQCLNGQAKVMVGTRSALFAPFENLGLIIVDEEQDSSYKQEDRFRYNARDLAVLRAQMLKIPIIMGSATPSLETYFQATQNKYTYYELNERIGNAQLPLIRIVNYVKEKEQTGNHLLVSQSIHKAIDHFYKERQQMLIFVGQRGFAQNAFCVACNEIQLCPNCSVGLKYHKNTNSLRCHYCDYERKFDEICSACKEKKLTLLGFGTQSIEEEIKTMHPGMVIQRLDSDVVTTSTQLHKVLNDFAQHKINMIIGTQMIAKGHDFSNIGFVGILGIDAHLGLPDFRAGERSFQNVVQVSGRAGRSNQKGHVILQSLMPQHMSIQYGIKQDFKDFAKEELKIREQLDYPPFTRMIQLRFLSNHQGRLKDFMATWGVFLNHVRKKTDSKDIKIMGPAEMPIAKVRGKHRYHVLIKVKRGLKSTDLLNYLTNDLDKRNLTGIQYVVDVDPMGLV